MFDSARFLSLLFVLFGIGIFDLESAWADDRPAPGECALPIDLPSNFGRDSVEQIYPLSDSRILVRGFAEFYLLESSTGKIQSVVDLLDHYSQTLFAPQYVIPLKSGRVVLVTGLGVAVLDGETLSVLSGDMPLVDVEDALELSNGEILLKMRGPDAVLHQHHDGTIEGIPSEIAIQSMVDMEDGRILVWGYGKLWIYSDNEFRLALDLTENDAASWMFLGPVLDGGDRVVVAGGFPLRLTPENQIEPIPVIFEDSLSAQLLGGHQMSWFQVSGDAAVGLLEPYVAILRDGKFVIDPFDGHLGPAFSIRAFDGGGLFVETTEGKAGIVEPDGTVRVLDPRGEWPSIDWENVSAYRLPSKQVILFERFYVPLNDGRLFDYADLFVVGEHGEITRISGSNRVPFGGVRTLSNGTALVHSLAGLFEITPELEIKLVASEGEIGSVDDVIDSQVYGVLMGTSKGIFRLERDLTTAELVRFPEDEDGMVDLVATEAGEIWAINRGILYRIKEECMAR